jgi:8-oxo-dGTP pyrophosphatase MutT (NUDIX family)
VPSNPPPFAHHFGVYGLLWHHGLLVTVLKSRGPYRAMLDLPGGSPEGSEKPEQTLVREFYEELGATVTRIGPWRTFTLHVTRSSDGAVIDFQHSGLLTDVRTNDRLRRVQRVEDVADVVLVDPDRTEQNRMSALLKFALRPVLDTPPGTT